MNEDNDYLASLLFAITQKDVEAFGLLYRATNRDLFRLIKSIVRTPPDADEILQDVYIKVWTRAVQFQPKYSAMAWLVAISKNQARDFLRKAAPHVDAGADLTMISDTSLNPELLMIAKQEHARAVSQIEVLDRVSAVLVRSAYLDGHSYKQLSDRHKIPLNTVRTMLRRGLIKMSKHADIEIKLAV